MRPKRTQIASINFLELSIITSREAGLPLGAQPRGHERPHVRSRLSTEPTHIFSHDFNSAGEFRTGEAP